MCLSPACDMRSHHCRCLFLLHCITPLTACPSSPARLTAACSLLYRLPPRGWNEDDRLWSCKGCIGWTKLDINKLAPALLKLMMLLMMTSQCKLGRLTFPEQELTSCFLGLWTGRLIWGFTTSCRAWKWRAVVCFSEIHIFKIIL